MDKQECEVIDAAGALCRAHDYTIIVGMQVLRREVDWEEAAKAERDKAEALGSLMEAVRALEER